MISKYMSRNVNTLMQKSSNVACQAIQMMMDIFWFEQKKAVAT